MGRGVGLGEGLGVGLGVGSGVGSTVGMLDEVIEGVLDAMLGEPLGCLDGLAVVGILGLAEGARVGIEDGLADGNTVGVSDVVKVGFILGCSVGRADIVGTADDGVIDGCIELVGLGDGASEGAIVGVREVEGELDKVILGVGDGRNDGGVVGFNVGNSDGGTVGTGCCEGNIEGVNDGRVSGGETVIPLRSVDRESRVPTRVPAITATASTRNMNKIVPHHFLRLRRCDLILAAATGCAPSPRGSSWTVPAGDATGIDASVGATALLLRPLAAIASICCRSISFSTSRWRI